MAAPIRFYFDKWNKRLVAGTKSTSAEELPDAFYGDTWTLHVYILEPSEATPFTYPNPYQVVSVANQTLKVAVTATIGTGTIAILAGQNIWAKSADNSHLIADLTFLDSGLKAVLDALPAGTESASLYFEVKLDEAGALTTIYQGRMDVFKRAIDNANVLPVAPDVALTQAEGLSLFVKNEEDAGAFRIRTSPNGRKWKDWIDDNGVQHLDEIV